MADYRELLRTAIDALPENTGANRRAVYEKARSALVSQLRAIDPPLPAREITQHRLNLEDCIREVEQEATDMLLGRHRDDAQAQADADAAKQADETASAADVDDPGETPGPGTPTDDAGAIGDTQASEPITAPEDAAADETAADDGQDAMAVSPIADAPAREQAEPAWDDPAEEQAEAVEAEPVHESLGGARDPEDAEAESTRGTEQSAPVTTDAAQAPEPAPVPEPEPGPGVDDEPQDTSHEPRDADESVLEEAGAGEDITSDSPRRESPHSIEEIIAQASAESATISSRSAMGADRGREGPAGAAPDTVELGDAASQQEKHFLASAHDDDTQPEGLVDVHGKPLGHHDPAPAGPLAAVGFGEAMSSVREVEIEANAPDSSDPQGTIDRAIAALDREARGEAEPEADGIEETIGEAESGAAASVPPEEMTAPAAEETRSGGFGALTVFLVIAIVLLAGGGAGGYWAWRQGYVDLDAVFAQSGNNTAATPTETAQDEEELEPVAGFDLEEEAPEAEAEPESEAETTAPDEPVNTTDTPETAESEAEAEPFSSETETPATNGEGPELAFEDRLPAEVEAPGTDSPAAEATEELAEVEGPQSLLLEEQANGNAGAVPYSGSVTWSRGTDELGDPTIVANASIPARNLEVEVLLRRNADQTLPASHLMEVDFEIAETFVGGSIANLPGVLLKDEELVQGRPLTGASARIVGNSFLFALSRASEQDVANNKMLLRERDWLDLAMVYGTGRRAILTLEKGEEGDAIFQAVMDAWAALDEAVDAEAEAEAPADTSEE